MGITLSILYFILGYVILKRYKFTHGFTQQAILAIWSIKVAVGFIFFFLFRSVYGNYFDALNAFHDVDNYYHEQTLRDYIQYFFTGWTHFDFSKGLINPVNTAALKDLGNQIFYRFLMISHAMSLGKIYPMMVIYNFVVILGQFALVQFFRKSGVRSEGILAVLVFLVPSILFWTSGLQKDGFTYCLFGFLFFHLYRFVREHNRGSMLWVILSALLLFFLRYYYIIAIFPAILLYWIQVKYGHRAYWLGILVLICGIVFLGTLSPSLNLINYFSLKQSEFNQIIGNSSIPSLKMDGGILEFIQNIFIALARVLFMPYPFQFHSLVTQVAAFENIIIILLFLLALIRLDEQSIKKPENAMVFFIALVSFLCIGLIVSNVGAIARYRSVFLILFYLPILSNANFSRLDERIKKIIYN